MKSLVPIKNIEVKFFVRTGLNLNHVKFLKDLYESGEQVDPVEVVQIEGRPKFYELIDGRHRIQAAKEAGYTSINIKLIECINDSHKILNAVLSNIGGALPPTLEDFEHSIELLIEQKMAKKDILENFPLPKPVIAKFYKATLNKIYRRTMRKAVDLVLKGNSTLKQAAEKFKVDPDDLKHLLHAQKSRENSIDDMLKGLETSVRSMSHNVSKKTKVAIELFEAGELSRSDLARLSQRIKESSKKIAITAEASRERLNTLLDKKEKTTTPQITKITKVTKEIEAQV